jgi:hypothetical protein
VPTSCVRRNPGHDRSVSGPCRAHSSPEIKLDSNVLACSR